MIQTWQSHLYILGVAILCLGVLADPAETYSEVQKPEVQKAEVQKAELQKTVYVEVQESKIRSQPKHWASGVAPVAYGVALQELGRDLQWIKVKDQKGAEGYIHVSAVTPRQILLKTTSGSLEMQPEESEILLAGKGFSKSIEEAYAAQHLELDFSWVARVEGVTVSEREFLTFLEQGKLNTAGTFQ